MSKLASSALDLPDSFESINVEFYTRGWTDGLPIVPPTDERVQAMVEASGRDGRDLIATLPLIDGKATVEKIAINAVMAGCEPEYMPVIMAAVEAIADKGFNLSSTQATTNPASPMLIINGPARKALDINTGSNAMGPGRKANATIGRAIRLIMLNVGGGIPGEVDKSTQGMPGKYTFCFGENEEESPWPPLHVDRGFMREDSTVTALSASGTHSIHAGNPSSADDLADFLAAAMVNIGVNQFLNNKGEPALLLCPDHARILGRGGYSKRKLQEHIHRKTRAAIGPFPEHLRKIIGQFKSEADGSVPIVERPELLVVAVVGGPGGLFSTFVPVLGYAAVTRKITGHTFAAKD